MPGAAASTAARNGFERLPPEYTVTAAAPVTTKSAGSMAVSTVEVCDSNGSGMSSTKRVASAANATPCTWKTAPGESATPSWLAAFTTPSMRGAAGSTAAFTTKLWNVVSEGYRD